MAAQARGLKGYRKVILALTGAILIVFGAVWMTAVFPSLMKVPADLDKTQTLVGTVQVADQTGALSDPIPVTQTRRQTATATEGTNTLIIQEVSTFADAETGSEIEGIAALAPVTEIIAIDRYTLEMVSSEYAGTERLGQWTHVERQGQWAPPTSLGEGDSYQLWNPAAGMPLEASYVSSENFHGLDAVVFQVNEDRPLGTEEQEVAPGMTMSLNKHLTTQITLTIEPTTGVVLDTDSHTVISYGLPGMDPVPAFISDLRYSDATIASYVDTAKSARSQLFIFGTIIPWIAIGCGAIFLITPVIIVAARKLRKSAVDEPAELPTPTSLPLDI